MDIPRSYIGRHKTGSIANREVLFGPRCIIPGFLGIIGLHIKSGFLTLLLRKRIALFVSEPRHEYFLLAPLNSGRLPCEQGKMPNF